MKLNPNFVNELFKICLRNKAVFSLALQHVKFNYLPDRYYKSLWKTMSDYFEGTDKLCTIGLLSQEFSREVKTIKVISEIKRASEMDPEDAINQLEKFIKNKLFIETMPILADKFNSNEMDESFNLMDEIATQLKEFQIRDQSTYTRIFGGFKERYQDRIDNPKKRKPKIPTGIPPLDIQSYGGPNRGDIGLILAVSGGGKSYALRWLGISAVRLGHRVVHIQVEGTEKECVNSYDSAIAGSPITKIEGAKLSSIELKAIDNALENVQSEQGEIFVKAYEQFDSATMKDVHTYCQEIVDKFGSIDLIILDYIDEIDPGDKKRYSTSNDGERKRREASAKKFKNLAMEFDCVGWTATQSNTVDKKDLDDPKFYFTRYNINEHKLMVKPFSYFITLNRTADEEANDVMRIFIDKFRKYKKTLPLFSICTNFDNGRFFINSRTIKKFGPWESR